MPRKSQNGHEGVKASADTAGGANIAANSNQGDEPTTPAELQFALIANQDMRNTGSAFGRGNFSRVVISAFSKKAEEVKNSRLVFVVGSWGAGRHSALVAWAKHAARPLVVARPQEMTPSGIRLVSIDSGLEYKMLNSAMETSEIAQEPDHQPIPPVNRHPATLVVDGLEKVCQSNEFDLFVEVLLKYAIGGPSVFVLTTQFDLAQSIWTRQPKNMSIIDWNDVEMTQSEVYALAAGYGNRQAKALANWLLDLHNWTFGIFLLAESKYEPSPSETSLPAPIQQFFKARIFDRLPADFQALLKLTVAFPAIDEKTCQRLPIPHGMEMLNKYVLDCLGMLRREVAGEVRFTLHPLLRRFIWGEMAADAERASAISFFLQSPREPGDKRLVRLPLEILISNRQYADMATYIEEEIAAAPIDFREELATRLLRTVPLGGEARHPVLAYWRAWSLRSSQPLKSREMFMLASDGFLREENISRAVKSWGWSATLIGMRFGAGRDLDRHVDWIETINDRVPIQSWYPAHPRVCCTAAVISGMRHPGTPIAEAWVDRAIVSLSLNSTVPIGSLLIIGMAVVLLSRMDAARLKALDSWSRHSADHLIGKDHEQVRLFIQACLFLVVGQLNDASRLLDTMDICSDDNGGIPICEAFLTLTPEWLGMQSTKPVADRFRPFMKWNSSTSDFYCLKLIAEAADSIRLGSNTSAKNALDLARSLSSNIEFPFIAEYCLLCRLQFACLMEDWEDARVQLDELIPIRANTAPIALLDFQLAILKSWFDMCTSPPGIARSRARNKLLDLLDSHEQRWIPIQSELIKKIDRRLKVTDINARYSLDRGVEPVVSTRQTQPQHEHIAMQPLVIKTFGELEVLDWNPVTGALQPLTLQLKLKTLLCMLLLRGTSGHMHVEEICDKIWPEAEADAARRNLDNLIHRLRKALGRQDAVIVRNAKVSINLSTVEVGLYRVLNEHDETTYVEDQTSVRRRAITLCSLLTGPLMLLDIAAETMQQDARRVHLRLKETFLQCASKCEAIGLPDFACELYSRVVRFIDVDPHAMFAHLTLLVASGKRMEAVYFFDRYKEELQKRCEADQFKNLLDVVKTN
jgi:two-component SAPR family response regulator